MPWQSPPFDPVADGVVTCRTRGQMDYCHSCRPFQILFQYYNGCVIPIRGERGDFLNGEFVAIVVGGSGDIDGVWEEGGEELAFVVEG